MSKLRLLSLFSGVGSFEKALTNLGVDYEIVGFSEIDKWAIESYCAIHNVDKNLSLGDISKIDEKTLPKSDLITYAFPCTSISLSGKGCGINSKTESGLLYEAERIIEYNKPKYAIVENVKNLISKRYIKDFNALLDRLDSYGYNNYYKVLNSRNYSIAQNRERVFVVSIRKDIDNGLFKFPSSKDNKARLKDVLLDDVDDKYYIDKDSMDMFTQVNDEVTGLTINVREATIKGYSTARVGDGINIGFPNSKTRRGRVGRDVVSTLEKQCVQATLGQDGRVRRLTPIEHWRLMGFNDSDYWLARNQLEKVFYNGRDMSDTQMYKQAGNAIVVNVLEEIFKNLFEIE